MKSKEAEYRELFMVEAIQNADELNKLFIDLEKDHGNKSAISSIFRITHTLKGNAMGLGLDAIADLSHVMEDIMEAIKIGTIKLNREMFDVLFRANDKLGDLIKSLETGEAVRYLGLKAKLEIMLKNAIGEETATDEVNDLNEESELDEGERIGSAGKEDAVQEITFADVIQIPVKKMDDLMTQVGQLIIERDRLITVAGLNGGKASEFDGLQRLTSNLQYSVMNARMVQMGFLFNKFHRIVRDVASLEKKKVDLLLKGTDIEVDRNILKIMSDSMIHLVRNAVSHGIESAEEREKIGKPKVGSITLNARYGKDSAVIMVSDDGHGIDHMAIRRKIVEKGFVSEEVASALSESDVIMYIFEPGFSNAEVVTEISGRGVGMDVVKKAAESVGGSVTVDTELGKGTTVNLILPLSMALKGALLFEIDKQEYGIPLSFTEAVVTLYKKDIHKISSGLMAPYLDSTIPVIFLKDLITTNDLSRVFDEGKCHKTFDGFHLESSLDIIVVSYSDRMVGIIVDKLLQQKEIFEKKLSKPLDNIKLLSGTTILGNGNVCPVIDIAAVSDLMYKSRVAVTV